MVPIHRFVFSFDGMLDICLVERGIINPIKESRHLFAGIAFKATQGW